MGILPSNRGEENGVHNIYSYLSQRVPSHPYVHGVGKLNAKPIFPRYLTKNSTDSLYGIRIAESHTEVAVTCLSYLLFRYFDGDISDDEVDGFIAKGGYVLHQYSQSNFLHHIKEAWRGAGGANEILRAATGEFLKARWNPLFEHVDSETPPSPMPWHIHSMDPEDFKKLNTIAAHLKARNLTESTKGLLL